MKIAEDGIKKKSNILIMAHRNSLLEQHRKLAEELKLDNNYLRIVSVFTEVNHLGENENPNIIIIDEAHLSEARSYKKVCGYYSNSIVILFTATPSRLDGKPLTLADTLIEGISADELIKLGNIADYDYYAPDLNLQLDEIDLVAGEYNNKQLENVMNKPIIYGDVLKYYKQLGENRQAIAYCINISHSKKVCKMFNKNNISAIHIDAKTKEKDREKILEDFKNGKYKILCNCNLISEGITLPTASVGLLLRPTTSLPLYIQQACRVLTPMKDKKALIIDFVNNIEKFGFPTSKREWSLENKISTKRKFDEQGNLIIKSCSKCYKVYRGNLTQCPFCGFRNIPKECEIKEKKNIELKQLKKEQEQEQQKQKYQRKKEIWQCQTMNELVAYAKEHNYKNPRWLGLLYNAS